MEDFKTRTEPDETDNQRFEIDVKQLPENEQAAIRNFFEAFYTMSPYEEDPPDIPFELANYLPDNIYDEEIINPYEYFMDADLAKVNYQFKALLNKEKGILGITAFSFLRNPEDGSFIDEINEAVLDKDVSFKTSFALDGKTYERNFNHFPREYPIIMEAKPKYTPEQNLNFLTKQAASLGFREGIKDPLRQGINNDESEVKVPITLSFTTYDKDNQTQKKSVNYELMFNKDKNQLYNLKNFTASSIDKQGNAVAQKFYVNQGKGFKAREAFNLLEGRSVRKNLQTEGKVDYTAWLKLNSDPNRQNDKLLMYRDFNYLQKLNALPILGKNDKERMDNLEKGLVRGDMKKILWQEPGTAVEVRYISANPLYANFNVLDKDLKPKFVDWKAINEQINLKTEFVGRMKR